jgi:hypothetical protein
LAEQFGQTERAVGHYHHLLRRSHTMLLRQDQQADKTWWKSVPAKNEIEEIHEIDCLYFCLQRFDKFSI